MNLATRMGMPISVPVGYLLCYLKHIWKKGELKNQRKNHVKNKQSRLRMILVAQQARAHQTRAHHHPDQAGPSDGIGTT